MNSNGSITVSQASLSAVPYVNPADPLTAFLDELDNEFPTVRSDILEQVPEYRPNPKYTAALYPLAVEVDIIRYICSIVSYLTVDESTRYVLRTVLYAEDILGAVLGLPRYRLPDPPEDYAPAPVPGEADGMSPPFSHVEPTDAVTKAKEVHKCIAAVIRNLHWKDSRLNPYLQLNEVLTRMHRDLDTHTLVNSSKLSLLQSTYLYEDR